MLGLVIEPDFDDICWTHFTVPQGTVAILEELPQPLRRMISGFVGTLIARKITRLNFDPNKADAVAIETDVVDIGLFNKKNPTSVREALILTAWWIEFDRRRQLARVRKHAGAKPFYTIWECPDCEESIKPERDNCSNHRCPSWDKLFLATGDARLRRISRTA